MSVDIISLDHDLNRLHIRSDVTEFYFFQYEIEKPLLFEIVLIYNIVAMLYLI